MWGLIPESGRAPGGGHGNPLKYSCLENPTDRGAWWAIVHKRVGHDRSDLAQPSHSTYNKYQSRQPCEVELELIANFISLQGTLMKNLLCTKNNARHQDEGRPWS